MASLAGRLALVTGGGSGIGRAVCSVLAREGAVVAAVDLNKSNVEETVSALPKVDWSSVDKNKENLPQDLTHKAFSANIGSSADVNGLLTKISENFKAAPSVVVHSAGITRDKFMVKMDEAAFDEVINVNLKGTYLINQTFGRAMAQAKVESGSIVNISSIIGKIGNMGQTNYAASKAGVIGLTKSAARELARSNIRVNAILPGFIATPMTDSIPEKLKQMTLFLIPMERLGKPEEIAEVCAFLASDKSSYMTGAVLEVTGGLGM